MTTVKAGHSAADLAAMTMDLPLVEWIDIEQIIEGENPLGAAMPQEDFERLQSHIAEHGIEDALVLGPADAEGARELIDGFHRLKIARTLGIKRVPFRECTKEPTRYAVLRQLARRNLSRSAQALVVFNAEREAITRLQGHFATFMICQRELAANYGVALTYLNDLCKAWERLVGREAAEANEKWAAFEQLIVEGGNKPSRALAGAAGQMATAGKAKAATDYTRLALGSLTSLEGAWDHVEEIDWRDEAVSARLEEASVSFTAKLPQLLRGPVTKAICETWSEGELKALRRRIDETLTR